MTNIERHKILKHPRYWIVVRTKKSLRSIAGVYRTKGQAQSVKKFTGRLNYIVKPVYLDHAD